MNNYEYIIASLPVLHRDWKFSENEDAGFYIDFIKEQCSVKDNKAIDILLSGLEEKNLVQDFYLRCKNEKNKFLNEYFTFDLQVRNAKAEYINKRLNRNSEQDVISIETDRHGSEIAKIFETEDLLEREKAIDELMWRKIDEITIFSYFDLAFILGFIAKLHIIDRWNKLDSNTGKVMFKKLAADIRSTFRTIEYNPE